LADDREVQILLVVNSSPEGRLSGTVTVVDAECATPGTAPARSFSGSLELLACLEDLTQPHARPAAPGLSERSPS
jgi:hypothetical protein